MPSAKGKPTDPKLKEKVTEEVKQLTDKDGSGKGQMATWKAVKVGKEYEARGGSYENEPGSKDKPEKGPPQKKSEATKKAETAKSKSAKKDENGAAGDEEEKEKPKANEGKKKDEGGEKKKIGRPKKGDEKKPPKEQREGDRKSQRMRGISPLLGTKRKYNTGTNGEESAAKKGKVKK